MPHLLFMTHRWTSESLKPAPLAPLGNMVREYELARFMMRLMCSQASGMEHGVLSASSASKSDKIEGLFPTNHDPTMKRRELYTPSMASPGDRLFLPPGPDAHRIPTRPTGHSSMSATHQLFPCPPVFLRVYLSCPET